MALIDQAQRAHALRLDYSEPVPPRSRPRLRPLARVLRRGENAAYRAGEWLEETAPARTIRLARLLGDVADRLDPIRLDPIRPSGVTLAVAAAASRTPEAVASAFGNLILTRDPTLELRRRARAGDVAAMEELEAMGAPGRNVPPSVVRQGTGWPEPRVARGDGYPRTSADDLAQREDATE